MLDTYYKTMKVNVLECVSMDDIIKLYEEEPEEYDDPANALSDGSLTAIVFTHTGMLTDVNLRSPCSDEYEDCREPYFYFFDVFDPIDICIRKEDIVKVAFISLTDDKCYMADN